MCPTQHILTTRLAELEKEPDGVIVQRFKKEADFDPNGFLENQQARITLGAGSPYAVLSILPTDITIHLKAFSEQLLSETEEVHDLRAMAIVAADALGHTMVSIYMKYLTFDFPVKVFATDQEKEARAWLREMLDMQLQ